MNENRHTFLKEDQRLLAAVRQLVQATEGRYFFHCMLGAFGVRQSAFMTDPHEHAHATGYQEAGLMLEDIMVTADFDNYILMLKENAL